MLDGEKSTGLITSAKFKQAPKDGPAAVLTAADLADRGDSDDKGNGGDIGDTGDMDE